MKRAKIAIVGATGMVGRAFLKVLDERNFDIDKLYLFSSKKSAGTKLKFKEKEYIVEELTEDSFKKDIDIALFSAGGNVSKKFAPIAKENGVIVIDNSSIWRMERDIPLIVPEVNPDDINWHKGIIANPNCSTIQCVVPLKVLNDAFKIKRVVYSSYQAVSGSGAEGINDLENGINGEENKKYPYQIAYNCIPHIDEFTENLYTKEEIKMIEETKKILGDSNIKVTATTVRVPVRYGHSVSVNLEFEKEFELSKVFELLKNKKGIVLKDDPQNNIYPMPTDVEGQDEIYVGRVRRDYSLENGLNMWVVADNIRKGAATNAVQIAELLINNI